MRGVDLGNLIDYQVLLGGGEIRIQANAAIDITDGDEIFVQVKLEKYLVLKS